MLAEKLITEAGCDGVYYCVQSGEPNRFKPEEYHKIVRPSDLYVLEHANRFSENNIMHMCGWSGEPNQIKLWQDYPVKVVNWAVFVGGCAAECASIWIFGDPTAGEGQARSKQNAHSSGTGSTQRRV